MSRHARAVDANQSEVVKALRSVGALVQHLHGVGNGCPDLVVAYRKRTVWLEVKDGTKPPSARKLTPAEEAWHRVWTGAGLAVYVVSSVEEALQAIGARP